MWWIWHGAKRPPTLRPGQTTRAVSPPVGCQKPQPPSPFIVITQLESWYSFYHPTKGRRLSRPRHCSRGVQLCIPCPRLFIVVVFTINMQLPTVGFEPWSSHTAVRHVTSRPLRPLNGCLYLISETAVVRLGVKSLQLGFASLKISVQIWAEPYNDFSWIWMGYKV